MGLGLGALLMGIIGKVVLAGLDGLGFPLSTTLSASRRTAVYLASFVVHSFEGASSSKISALLTARDRKSAR